MRKLLLFFAVMVVASVSASAGPVVLTPAELGSFTFITATGDFNNFSNLSGGHYSAQWNTNPALEPYAVMASSGITLGAPRGVAGDVFTLVVTNSNGNPWNFTVSINNGAQSSGPFLISNNGGTHVFSFSLPAGGLTQVTVKVGQLIPIAGEDRGAEYRLSNVPEPGSMLLLGTGLLGLAGAARRRFTKKL